MTFFGDTGTSYLAVNYPLIDVTATIAHSEKTSGNNPDYHFIPDKKTKKRVDDLGLTTLRKMFEKNTTGIFEDDQVVNAVQILEQTLMDSSTRVPTKWLRRYSEKNALEAIKFLELFSIYCAQKVAMSVWKESQGLFGKPISSSEFFRMTQRLGAGAYIEKNTFAAIGELEFLVDNSRVLKKDKSLSEQHLKILKTKLRKLFTNNLSLTEQAAYSKALKNALKILKGYYL